MSVNSNRMPRVRAVVSTRRTCADMAQLRRGGAVVGEGGSLEGYAPSWAPDALTSKAGIATGHAGIETEWPAASRDAMRPGE